MLDFITIDMIAQFFGGLGFVLGLIAFWQLKDKNLFILTAAYNAAFLVQYFLLGAMSSSVLVIVLVASSWLAVYKKTTGWMLFFMLVAIGQWFVVGKIVEIPVVMATVLGLYAFYKMEGTPLRVAVFMTAIGWSFSAIYFEAWFSIAFKAFTMIMMIMAAYRLEIRKRNELASKLLPTL